MKSSRTADTARSTFVVRWAQTRAFIRRSEVALIGLAVIVGALAAIMVALTTTAVDLLHRVLFDLEPGQRLSAATSLKTPLMAAVPVAGGLILGTSGTLIKRWRPRRPVDPIEANALRGGRMSLIDSVLVALQTVVSSGFGASVGLEAGFTQIGSGLASSLGAVFGMRRADMRILVGCGAAGAIAAAFGAPLTGAFYAFELIIGSYTLISLAPVIAAAITGVLAARRLGVSAIYIGYFISPTAVVPGDLVVFLALAAVCAIVGIGIMRGVTLVEAMFGRSGVPGILQPVMGGMVVGGIALITPHVLSSGHGALAQVFREIGTDVGALCLVVVLKSVASAVSIGSGFRGGLFFASLFLGGMIGKIFAGAVPLLAPALAPNPAACVVVGMAALAVAIVGGPLTMSFLALESTGDLALGAAILTVSTLVSVIVRRTFGYSFATWRLHLRGESIRGAQDIGWIRNLTVGRMMTTGIESISADTTLPAFRERFPLGSAQWVAAVDATGRYQGLVSVTDVHLATAQAQGEMPTVKSLLRQVDDVLLPTMNIQEAAQMFERSEAEVLVVLDNRERRRVLGMLSEAHVLRRYTEELEKARRDLFGEKWLGEA